MPMACPIFRNTYGTPILAWAIPMAMVCLMAGKYNGAHCLVSAIVIMIMMTATSPMDKSTLHIPIPILQILMAMACPMAGKSSMVLMLPAVHIFLVPTATLMVMAFLIFKNISITQ